MEEKKSLVSLIGSTAVFGLLAYPMYSGLTALAHSNVTFIDGLKDPKTAASVAGLTTGYFIFHGAAELINRYRTCRMNRRINRIGK